MTLSQPITRYLTCNRVKYVDCNDRQVNRIPSINICREGNGIYYGNDLKRFPGLKNNNNNFYRTRE